LECGAPGELGIFHRLDGGEVLGDKRGVGQRPQMLSWLQLRRGRGPEEQRDMVPAPAGGRWYATPPA
jgi:hypothetical protein